MAGRVVDAARLARGCRAATVAGLVWAALACGGLTRAEQLEAARFDTTGAWEYGSLPGHERDRATIWSRDAGATATWLPRLQSVTPVRVGFYVVPHEKNTRRARVEVSGAAPAVAATLDLSAGKPRWETIGVYPFTGSGAERITLSSAGPGALRLAAVRLEILDPNDTTKPLQTLVLDDIVSQSITEELAAGDEGAPPVSGPPAEAGEWELAFEDEFTGTALDPAVWTVHDGETWGALLSTRWKENCVVEDGLLRLVTRKESRGGKDWTSGFVSTKAFRQAYGYWEARYRYAAAPGLNNAFWTNPFPKDKSRGFEIDINEGHWPNTVNMSLHQAGHPSLSKAWRPRYDLGRDFHTYAVLWGEKEIVFSWDGKEVDRKPNTQASLPGPVMFSTAVFRWAGPITDALDGKSMDIDWVRIWRRK
jgi:beta-glucanase (GH16 family)